MRTSDVQFEELVDTDREPTRPELAALMRHYVVGNIDDEMVERLHTAFQALLAEPARRRAEGSAFRANGPRYHGQAWKELLSPHDNRPSLAELALWLAIVTPGYPSPRPYCPVELVGTWQEQGSGATWRLANDGTFSTTNESILRERAVRWCVHLIERRGDFHRDRLWLLDASRHNVAPQQLIIREFTSDQLRLLRPGGDSCDVGYNLTRI